MAEMVPSKRAHCSPHPIKPVHLYILTNNAASLNSHLSSFFASRLYSSMSVNTSVRCASNNASPPHERLNPDRMAKPDCSLPCAINAGNERTSEVRNDSKSD